MNSLFFNLLVCLFRSSQVKLNLETSSTGDAASVKSRACSSNVTTIETQGHGAISTSSGYKEKPTKPSTIYLSDGAEN